jgi:multiple sugar transport system substrate-binding protein
MERGYMRPRYAGYLYFQDKSGEPLYQYLKNGGNAGAVLEKMNTLYRESLTKTELILS